MGDSCEGCGRKITRRDKQHRDYPEDGLCVECRELKLWDAIGRIARK